MRSIHLPLECSGFPAHARFNLISESTVFPCVCVSLFCIVFKDRFCAACESFLLSLADSLVIISPFPGFVNPIFQLFLRLHTSIHRKSERSIHVQFLSFEISRHSTSHTLIMRPIFSIFFRMKRCADFFCAPLAHIRQNSCAPCVACSCWVFLYSAYQSGISVEKRSTNQFIIFTAFSMFPE